MQYVYAELSYNYYWKEHNIYIQTWPKDMASTYKKGSAELLFIWED